MNKKQVEWVLEKALRIVKKYENKKITDKDFEEAFNYAQKVYEDSKKNEFCKQVMFVVLDSLNDNEEKYET